MGSAIAPFHFVPLIPLTLALSLKGERGTKRKSPKLCYVLYDGKLDLVKAAIRNLSGQDSVRFDLFLHSDVPPGTGLGFSSTVVVVLVGLLKEFQNMPLTEYEITNMAYVIERKDLGIKRGLQDQYAATFGGFNFMEFSKEGVVVNPLKDSSGYHQRTGA